ncbi:unnamed protein product [Linum trigynum]|uniref:Uncharacterized protein n=1 Tax=Linum trigynum TaxID=586398 RepID=A0AAV2EPZ0_9ROSI
MRQSSEKSKTLTHDGVPGQQMDLNIYSDDKLTGLDGESHCSLAVFTGDESRGRSGARDRVEEEFQHRYCRLRNRRQGRKSKKLAFVAVSASNSSSLLHCDDFVQSAISRAFNT